LAFPATQGLRGHAQQFGGLADFDISAHFQKILAYCTSFLLVFLLLVLTPREGGKVPPIPELRWSWWLGFLATRGDPRYTFLVVLPSDLPCMELLTLGKIMPAGMPDPLIDQVSKNEIEGSSGVRPTAGE
jgi:hypothetical protein